MSTLTIILCELGKKSSEHTHMEAEACFVFFLEEGS